MSMHSTQLRRHLRAWLARHGTTAQAAPWAIALWDQALDLYARPGVASACLTLQDQTMVDVCELLWACWLQRHGLTPDEDAPRHLAPIRAWQAEITRPLRAQRRGLKQLALTDPQVAELRDTLKRAELLAERECLRRLADLATEGHAIRPLTEDDLPLDERLVRAGLLQKKMQVSALQTLETQLDPLSADG